MSKWYSITFGKAVLRGIGAPYTVQNDLFLRAWAVSEDGGPNHIGAQWNPFNTTRKMPGSTDFNVNDGYPVQNYPTWGIGVAATVQSLLNGRYGNLVGCLRAGNTPALTTAKALAASPWGTGILVARVITANTAPEFPIGNCYPTPPTSWARDIRPNDTGADVDELLRCLGNTNKFYSGDPVAKVKKYQLVRPWLWPADGICGPKTWRGITGHR
jgi:hypothetical protein